jgi:hypothetical protein
MIALGHTASCASYTPPITDAQGHRAPTAVIELRDVLEDTLVGLERQSWDAWQRRNGAFFEAFLSDDHVEIGFRGITRKAAVVASVSSPACIVRSYSLDGFGLTRFTTTTALLTYHAAQETVCDGRAVPSPVWASSLYVRRGNRWVNAVYQQTQARP